MPQLRRAKISFSPAEKTNFGGVSIEIMNDIASKEVQFSSLPELKTQIEAFAKEQTRGVATFVRITDGGRKPNGFKQFLETVRFFNLDKPKEDEPAQLEAQAC